MTILKSWPKPEFGHMRSGTDIDRAVRVADAISRFGEIFVPHEPQMRIIARMEALRLSTIGKRGTPLPGVRLSQISQAGKTSALKQYAIWLQKEKPQAELNPYRVLYLNLRTGVTLKMLCTELLTMLNDPFPNRIQLDVVLCRLDVAMRKRQVELLIVDEVQWLAKARVDCQMVTDQLKNFLDRGIVPIVLAGNEESLPFFTANNQLSARLGTPLELHPVTTDRSSDAVAFKQFCHSLDVAMVERGVIEEESGFRHRTPLAALMKASGGHVGRVSRIVAASLEHALWRGAPRIELYDLAAGIEAMAVSSGWTSKNPFGLKGSGG